MNTLKAEKRNMTIKAKKLRRKGFVTGKKFIYQLLMLLKKQTRKLLSNN